MTDLKYQELLDILKKHDIDFYDSPAKSSETQELEAKDFDAELKKYIQDKNIQPKAVLGIDIYRYGSMEEKARNLVPFVAHILRDEAIKLCLKSEPSIFHNITKESIEKDFINTGDGGYFIFDTPLHAFVFAIYFEMTVRLFNSYRIYPKLRTILGVDRPTLRYAMTYDDVYKYGNNDKYSHYGAGIITNARILSKDKLDRFLIDEKVYDWFMRNTNGIETLRIIYINELVDNIEEFKNLNIEVKSTNIFLNDEWSKNKLRYGLNSIDIQKIGEIKAKEKENNISIYNLHIQYSTVIAKQKLTVSLGNLNTSGISEI